MKLGRLLIAGLFMAGSMSASAVDYSVHKVSNMTLKYAALKDGKIRKETMKTKNIAQKLNNGQKLDKKESLAAIVPCPVANPPGPFYLVIWDEETGMRKAGTFGINVTTDVSTGSALKDGEISKLETLSDMDGDHAAVSLIYDAKAVNDKKDESGLDGQNCAKQIKSKDLVGGGGDQVIEEGKIIIGKVRDGANATEVKMPIPGTEWFD